jgi:BlaI family transcriptional regulator, penicillinase repressor
MPPPKLSPLELQVMETLWAHGCSSAREILERFLSDKPPAYTTIQTIIRRLEVKNAIRRVKKTGGANIYEASVSREEAKRRLINITFRF